MKVKHFAAVVAAVCIAAAFSGCGNAINKNEGMVIPDEDSIITAVSTAKPAPETEEDAVPDVKQFEEQQITAAAVSYTAYSKTYNAESGSITGKASLKKSRKGYKGKGYVTNISSVNDWELSFDLPSSQYYNISVTVACDEKVKNGLAVNGEKISEFTTKGSGGFETVSFNNIRLEEGINRISIVPENGVLDVDYVNVEASDDIAKMSMGLTKAELTNKNADYNAKALYTYITGNYGLSVILGQYDAAGSTIETDLIYRTTGKYPAIRFGDMMSVTDDDSETSASELAAAEEWSKNGGIVGYMWHWNAPMGTESCYSEETDFELSKAVTKKKIAEMDIADIKKLNEDGKISDECVAIVEDIDKVSAQLAKLRDEGVAVIWRPVQEASNGYFWWGEDEESYKWLWKLIYTRQTEYHKLNNLIWVWSAQNAGWYVGDEYCDILSVDVYSDNASKDGQVNSLLFLQNISRNKPIAMSECGNFPSIQSIADERAMWSYIGQWGGNYLLNEEGKLSEEFNTEADLITMYNNNLTITRDKLPDFTHMANILKEADEAEESSAAEKENKKTDKTSESE